LAGDVQSAVTPRRRASLMTISEVCRGQGSRPPVRPKSSFCSLVSGQADFLVARTGLDLRRRVLQFGMAVVPRDSKTSAGSLAASISAANGLVSPCRGWKGGQLRQRCHHLTGFRVGGQRLAPRRQHPSGRHQFFARARRESRLRSPGATPETGGDMNPLLHFARG